MDKMKFEFRYLRPDLEEEDGLSFLSGVYDFSASIPLNPKLNVVGSIPFVTIGGDWMETESSIGNIYVGLQQRMNSSPGKYLYLSLGAFLPTMPDDKFAPAFLGLYSDFYEIQKFLPNFLTLYGNLAFHRAESMGLMFGVEIGPNVTIPTKDEDEDMESEVYVHYGLTLGYRTNYIDVKAELLGIAIITEDVDNFGDRFIHALAFGVHWNRGKIRPGVFYKIYLKEDMKDIMRGIIGIKLEVIL